jgi:hypothetical protein
MKAWVDRAFLYYLPGYIRMPFVMNDGDDNVSAYDGRGLATCVLSNGTNINRKHEKLMNHKTPYWHRHIVGSSWASSVIVSRSPNLLGRLIHSPRVVNCQRSPTPFFLVFVACFIFFKKSKLSADMNFVQRVDLSANTSFDFEFWLFSLLNCQRNPTSIFLCF